ncbi:MAG: helix-turn-helix domain-containing protein [Spirochaetes bacterium]|nr:helix-turn-helix domain-containing protein [Spirochaetota bacterium]MBU0955356.1 helix-turn-helix domain-containing protein [Spirochaetota bacterium]
MKLDHESCYSALSARDARFDGSFFVGVSSTGIYCRPVCPARTPLSGNCRFFGCAAAAEAAGYRPCLRCRPELAPGNSPLEAGTRLATLAARRIDIDGLEESNLAKLAQSLDISERQLRRSFIASFGVRPVEYLTTRRLLAAKALLTDTRLSITEIALASGFGSLRRFNTVFKAKYGLAPRHFRKEHDELARGAENIQLLLGYRPPFDWQSLLEFLEQRAIPGVEFVQNGSYSRTVSISQNMVSYTGWLTVNQKPERNALQVILSDSLAAVLPAVLTRLRALFDLDADPQAILQGIAALELPAVSAQVQAGLRLPGCFDSFEMSVRAILGQQISVRAARTLAGRLAAAFGAPHPTALQELTLTFPTAADIAAIAEPVADSLGPLGITGSRSRSIAGLAKALQTGSFRLDRGTNPERLRPKLLALPGIGPWTADYIIMRALSWPDIFLHTDLGIRKALEQMGSITIPKLAEEARPWGSYLTMALWRSLK